MTTDRRARLIVVRGRVQGVGFRASCAAVARRLGTSGWVRNRPDGTVEVAVIGPEPAVTELTDWCHHGPPAARVTDLAVTDLAVTDLAVTDRDRDPNPADPDPAPNPADPDPAPNPADPDPAPNPADPDPAPNPADPDSAPNPADASPGPDPGPTVPGSSPTASPVLAELAALERTGTFRIG